MYRYDYYDMFDQIVMVTMTIIVASDESERKSENDSSEGDNAIKCFPCLSPLPSHLTEPSRFYNWKVHPLTFVQKCSAEGSNLGPFSFPLQFTILQSILRPVQTITTSLDMYSR